MTQFPARDQYCAKETVKYTFVPDQLLAVVLQLDEDMESMARLKDGMKIKAHVLEVCRVMVRAEKAEHRLAILKVIQVLRRVLHLRQRAVRCCFVVCVMVLDHLERCALLLLVWLTLVIV